MGQHLHIEWRETGDQLRLYYRWACNPHCKIRLQALWHLRCGKRLQDVVEIVGVCYRTLQYWVAWYRAGGLAEVLRRIPGYGSGGIAKLTALQQRALAAKVTVGLFRTLWDAIQWVQDRWKIQYRYSGLLSCIKRLKGRLKIPRPRSVKADMDAQIGWKSRGLSEALRDAELTSAHHTWFSDEMRFGLWGQTRRRWGLRSVRIIQPIQIEFA